MTYRDSVGWLEALLVDAEDAGWCMSPYCTTCGCWDFRRAYWAAAARQVGIAHVFESPSHLRDILEGLSGAERESVVRALVGGLRQLPPIWIGSEGFQTIMKDLDPPLILHGVSMNLSTELDATPAGNYLRARRALAEREIAEREERRVFDSREAIEERRRVKREEKAVAHARRQEETRQRNAERSELIAALALLTPVERISRFATDPGLHLDRVPVELIPTQERDLVALEKAEAVALLTRISRRRGAWGRLRRMLEHLLEDESESDT